MDDRDPEAFRALYGTHYATVRRYLAARTHADLVDDLTAETFLVAWRRFGVIPDHTLPWLLNVATKVLSTQRRTSGRADALAVHVARVAVLDVPGIDFDVERRHRQRALLAALATLSPDDQELMLLHVWDDLPAREIARVIELSPVTTRARLSRARRRLARALREELADDPAPAAPKPGRLAPPRPAPANSATNPTETSDRR